MEQQRLEYLLRGYQDNSLNEFELAELNEWYHQLGGGRADFESWINAAGGEDSLRSHMYDKFNKKLVKRKLSARKMWYGAAAAILLIFFATGTLLKHKTNDAPLPKNEVAKLKAAPLPGTNKATLVLANGSSVQLGDSTNTTLTSQPGVSIKKEGNGKLVYSVNNGEADPKIIAYNTIITPRAGQYQLVLPDGSKVWLNSQTTLRYPVRFVGNERRIELKGEAYFEVVHNDAMPFRVVTDKWVTNDLGTHFNIKAYPDDDVISTTLLEGSVAVTNNISGQSKLLVPGNQANMVKKDGAIAIANPRLDEVVAWKNGYFIFDNTDIKSIMKLISRWYDVDVTYQLDKNIRLGGTFSRAENLPDLLKSIEIIGNIHCQLKERRVVLSN